MLRYFLILSCICCNIYSVFGYNEIIDILESPTDLTWEEKRLFRPLFEAWQTQYDFIANQKTAEEIEQHLNPAKHIDLTDIYEDTLKQMRESLGVERESLSISANDMPSQYHTKLPSVEELLPKPNQAEISKEQWNEYLDLTALLQESLDEAEMNLNELVRRSLQMEALLLKLNKPKIVTYVYKALSALYKVASRVGRAAYCTYSHIPEMQESLVHINGGIACYNYTTQLILRIQTQTVDTVITIKKSVHDMAAIYKKVNNQNSMVGKLAALILNLTKITKAISQTYAVAMQGMDDVQNHLPGAAMATVECGQNFATNIPFIVQTVTNVTTCILYVDDAADDYEFMKPENQRQ